ncbi:MULTISPECIES: hypothetical protein [Vibrio]|uniref:hypothetical protein n=1 Tax=Vibrio TaxID=662 RepID=UPI001120964C|nr:MULTISPECIES: hypothetical protein [Vibrio]EHR5319609.1 hypothetical protein [Vibrio parahaemolyticus]MBH9742166.1 hypothetical protein [Vibrio navarrensis]MDF4582238.1 hypothetical protein [Vibrio parahaemolyticus]TOA02984.1 hypothetical protein CGK35_15400 [Vibrio parahaemolyticus]
MKLNLINKTFLPMFGDEGGDDSTITLTQAELESKIADAVAGLKDNKDTILGEKKDLQSKFDSTLQELDKYKNIFSQFEQDKEFATALSGGEASIRSLMQNRVDARDSEWKSKFDAKQKEIEQLTSQLTEKDDYITNYKASSLISAEASKNDFLEKHPSAIQDVVDTLLKDGKFSDRGDFQFVDKNGNVRIGKDGNSLTIAERIDELRESKPYLFKTMGGSGSGGSKSAPGSITMTKKDFNNQIILSSDKEAQELQSKVRSGAITLV